MVGGLRRVVAPLAGALTICATMALGPASPAAYAGATGTYVVLYADQALPSGATEHVRAAGGSVVATYPEIGVVIAKSAASSFKDQVKSDSRVAGVSATGAFGTRLKQSEPAANEPAAAADLPSVEDRQWDMQQ